MLWITQRVASGSDEVATFVPLLVPTFRCVSDSNPYYGVQSTYVAAPSLVNMMSDRAVVYFISYSVKQQEAHVRGVDIDQPTTHLEHRTYTCVLTYIHPQPGLLSTQPPVPSTPDLLPVP